MRRLLASTLAAASLAAAASAQAQLESDPIEPTNRRVFWLNDRLDVLVLEPLAHGWVWITPRRVRTSVDNFFTNLRFPVRLVGTLAQGELRAGADELARFTVNTTVGVAGLFDPASRLGLELHDEDFGQALGSWGLPTGPYLVLPLLGPSSPRDALGLLVDAVLGAGLTFVSPEAGAAAGALALTNSRALALDDVREAKQASLDYYTFVRNAYVQLRQSQIENGGLPGQESDDDLYELDEDE